MRMAVFLRCRVAFVALLRMIPDETIYGEDNECVGYYF